MPLSDHEQEVLDEIERNLYEEDPRLSRDRGSRVKPASRLKLGVLLFLLGLAILVGFFFSGSLIIGVLAFGAMVAGIVFVAGSATDLASTTRSSREHVSRRFSDWEQRIRERYKKR